MEILFKSTNKTIQIHPKDLSSFQTTDDYRIIGYPEGTLVAMLDFYSETLGTQGWPQDTFKAIAYITKTSASTVLMDFYPNPLLKGNWALSVKEYGDFSNGIESCGDVLVDVGRINLDSLKDEKKNFKFEISK